MTAWFKSLKLLNRIFNPIYMLWNPVLLQSTGFVDFYLFIELYVLLISPSSIFGRTFDLSQFDDRHQDWPQVIQVQISLKIFQCSNQSYIFSNSIKAWASVHYTFYLKAQMIVNIYELSRTPSILILTVLYSNIYCKMYTAELTYGILKIIYKLYLIFWKLDINYIIIIIILQLKKYMKIMRI